MACVISNTHVYKLTWCWVKGIWRKGLPRNTALFFWSCIFHLPLAKRLDSGFAGFLCGTIGIVTNPRRFCSCSRTQIAFWKCPDVSTVELQLCNAVYLATEAPFAAVNCLFYICHGPAVWQSSGASVASWWQSADFQAFSERWKNRSW